MGLAKFWLRRSFDTYKGYNVTVPGLNTIRIARPVPKDIGTVKAFASLATRNHLIVFLQ